MNILVVSFDLSGAGLVHRLKREGHNVRLFVDEKNQKQNHEGLIEKVSSWKRELKWVGNEGLIIFDSCGYGKEQDELRKKGYSVIGGSEIGDRLEHERQYGQKIFFECGIPILESRSFKNIKSAINFVKKNSGPWVIKQNGHSDKIFNYVGSLEDGRDVIDVLRNYDEYEKSECRVIDLQRRVDGIEIGVARYFNGNDWVGPIEINLEHKDLAAGDLGPKTFEMGTLMWFDDDEKNRLFQFTLAKMKNFLKSIDFRGDIDINCIVNGQNLYPLEVTTRFGWPATHLHSELIKSPMGEFFKAVADGKQYDLKYRKEFGIVTLVATPPFPYQIPMKKYSSFGEKIYFKDNMTKEEFNHVHLEDVSINKDGEYYISSNSGFVLHVTSFGETVEKARKKGLEIINKIVIPKKFFRNDIGLKFERTDGEKLKAWGWIREAKKRKSETLVDFLCRPFVQLLECGKKMKTMIRYKTVMVKKFTKKSLDNVLMLENRCFPKEWQYEDADIYYEDKLKDSENINIFLKENDDVIGYVLASFHNKEVSELKEYDPKFVSKKDVYYIETIQVLPEKSGRGGAKKLLIAICEEAKKRGINRFSIHARKLNGFSDIIRKLFSEGLCEVRQIKSWIPAQGEPYEYIEWTY